MTFRQLCEYTRTDIKADGDSPFDLPTSDFVTSPFGLRVEVFLKFWTVWTHSLFAHREPFTGGNPASEIDTSDPAVCAKAFFNPERVWISGEELWKASGAEELYRTLIGPMNTALPGLYAIGVDRYKILLNAQWDLSVDGCYVTGFYRHPSISSDDDVVRGLNDEDAPLFSYIANKMLREFVASDEAGLTRLGRLDRDAENAVRRIRGMNLSRHVGVIQRR